MMDVFSSMRLWDEAEGVHNSQLGSSKKFSCCRLNLVFWFRNSHRLDSEEYHDDRRDPSGPEPQNP